MINNDHNDLVPPDINGKNLTVLSQPIKGSYAARNMGIEYAKSDILAFTDADCIPDKDWLLNALNAMADGRQRIAGQIKLFFKSSNLTIAEKYENRYAFPQDKYAQVGFGATANMITYKIYFTRYGNFRGELLSSGDYEWGMRLKNNNIHISYEPDVVVDHPARSTIRELLDKDRRRVGGYVQLADAKFSINECIKLLRSLIPPLFIFKDSSFCDELSFGDSLRLFFLHWLLSADSSLYRICLLVGLCKLRR